MKKIWFFILSAILLICSIVSLVKSVNPENYNLPVYISENLNVYGNPDNIVLTGKLKNRSNESVHLTFTIYIHDGHDNYATYDKEITIQANSEFDLKSEYISTASKNVYYTKAYIQKCKINGESVTLEFLKSDSQDSIHKPNYTGIIVCFVGCVIFLLLGIYTKNY